MPAKSIARSSLRVPGRVPTPEQGTITLPPGAHGAPGDHHGRSGFGKCSHVFRKTGKKSGMVLFFSMIPIG